MFFLNLCIKTTFHMKKMWNKSLTNVIRQLGLFHRQKQWVTGELKVKPTNKRWETFSIFYWKLKEVAKDTIKKPKTTLKDFYQFQNFKYSYPKQSDKAVNQIILNKENWIIQTWRMLTLPQSSHLIKQELVCWQNISLMWGV